jgi:cell division cycle 14
MPLDKPFIQKPKLVIDLEYDDPDPEIIEIIADRLYWVAHKKEPEASSDREIVCIDHKLIYKSLNQDFGPLNLGMMTEYILMIRDRLNCQSAKRGS